MATKFADIAKGPKDLLNDDFTSKFSLKCKKDAGPVTVTIEIEQDSPSSALKSKVGSKFSYAKFNVDKGQITATGSPVFETSLIVCPSVKMSFKSAGKGANLGFDYVKNNFYATGLVDVMDMSKVCTSACVLAAPGFKLGADATYNISGSVGLAGANVGASYKAGPVFASVIASSKSVVNAGLLYNVNSDLTLASQTTHSSDNLCTVLGVGAKYKLDPEVGTIKAKFGSDGILSACLIRDIAPKVTLTVSGSVATNDPFNTFKPGLGISM